MNEIVRCLGLDSSSFIQAFSFYERNDERFKRLMITGNPTGQRATPDSIALSVFMAMPSINKLGLVELNAGRVYLVLNQLVSDEEMKLGESAIKNNVPVMVDIRGLIIANSDMNKLIEHYN